MSPRVTYWTGTWDPRKEAVSKEIAALRSGDRRRAPVVAFSPGNRTALLSGERTLTLSSEWWLVLRATAALVERRGEITHVFGGQSSWHLVRALGRRPMVLTAVVPRHANERLPHVNFARVVVETEDQISEWLEAGVPPDRVTVIRPGVDLARFRPVPDGRPERMTLVFASSPANASELAARGIDTLVEVARRRPDVDIVVPWREWGDTGAARRALESLRPPPNFVVRFGNVANMAKIYASAHATIVCFAEAGGKATPNFVIEGLACGLPCIAVASVGVASLLERSGAGIVASRTPEALDVAISRLETSLDSHAVRARALAEAEFSEERFIARYDALYREIARDGARRD